MWELVVCTRDARWVDLLPVGGRAILSIFSFHPLVFPVWFFFVFHSRRPCLYFLSVTVASMSWHSGSLTYAGCLDCAHTRKLPNPEYVFLYCHLLSMFGSLLLFQIECFFGVAWNSQFFIADVPRSSARCTTVSCWAQPCSPLSTTTGNATSTSNRMCTLILHCQTALTRPRSLWVHDEGTYSADSKIKRVLPDRNIITVGAERFHCAGVSAGGFYENSLQSSGSVTPTPAKSFTPMSCARWHNRVPRYGWAHDEGTDGGGSIHDEIKVRVLHPTQVDRSRPCWGRPTGPWTRTLTSLLFVDSFCPPDGNIITADAKRLYCAGVLVQ